ncbi:MAG TPA: DUF4403 family protein [Bradyrhizobium sp.]|uniref:DUF4403 family protein n=1 Tax=Bradyrhizobium sp. TaxID=376 RepID=UPI002D7F26B3|nr:DUF4403 family protein [Bradyrhizobium sp.]HET7886396.1 DUF4403 family protein [Bradyrhizobium sp.]
MRLKVILIGAAVLAVSFIASLLAMNWLSPSGSAFRPAVVDLPPLPPAPRSSVILAQVTIPISAIRDTADRGTPRNFSGKADNPVAQVLQNADIGWTASRGPIGVAGGQDVLSLTTGLSGKLNVTGSLAAKTTGAVGDAIGGLIGGNLAKQIGSINIKGVNASAEIKGNVTVTSRPKFAAAWRIEPNLAGQVNLGDTNLSVAGARVSVPAQVKPLIDKNVADQINAAGNRIRNDPSFERNARIQWSKACRSIPLTAGNASAPPLWLELRPTRAVAVQPNVSASAITMTIGIEAETRITPKETTPMCPFPEKLSIVPPTQPIVSIGIPIDIPFADVDKLVEAQLIGRHFPEDGSGSTDVTVKNVQVAASGDRLLISLLINAREKASFISFGGEATVYIWGKPVLDQKNQILRLANVEMALESEAAFGLLGAAARAVMPHLQKTLAEKTTVDLKPFLGDAQKMMASAIADLQKNDSSLRVTTEIDNLGLSDIAYDSKTLRLIAEVTGTINVTVASLPGF